MSSSLPHAWSLIKDTFTAYVKTWDTMVRYSAWLIASILAWSVGVILLAQTSQPLLQLAMLATAVAGMAVLFWTSIRLYQVALVLETGSKVTATTTATAWSLVLPLLLVGLLQGVAVIGALVLLIIPGIYVGVRLGFSQLMLIDKNIRGRAALTASWELTKNRFWALFGRQLLAGFIFTFVMVIAMMVAITLVQLVAGNAFQTLLDDTQNPLGIAVTNLISGIVQAAVVPAMVLFQVKLYRALERAKSA